MPAILDPNNTSVDRMFCPPINETRYAYLKASHWERKHKYFFALNLRQCVDLLPRLIGSLIETIRFLGPEACAVSIVEGNSGDGTLEVLALLEHEFQRMGVLYYLRSATLNPSAGNRIQKLAMLRAMALSPVTGLYVPDIDPDSPSFPSTPSTVPQLPLTDDATVLFSNDVAACAEDFLELLHQRSLQKADMSCAMDWTHPGPNPLFYDVWVSRALNGDLFFDIPPDTGSWDNAEYLFWNEPVARSRLAAKKPFQVFACWNGAVAFTAAPLVKNEVGFRAAEGKECFQGEPQLFCKDMWFKGYGKIMVVPSVNLEYTDKMGRQVKKELGYVSDTVAAEGEVVNGTVGLMVPWQLEAPEMVKCMPTFNMQSWMAWNESLPLEG
ncbi:cryptococcal mannosyltransferase 1-domain-containing protein [Coniochaeta sp. 2T2.1]|nr:cryptococcal mannosyltransferase 1-domain-containing protein [Coniochaeta sp. 2T2.1]